jgi:hypothetical protein
VIKNLLPKLKVLNEEKQVETLTKALNATGDQLLKKIKGELK